MKNLDLNEISKHIEKSKAENKNRMESLGESTGIPVSGDKFLNNLKRGLVNGELTPAATQVKAVNQATMVKDGERGSVDTGLAEQVNSTPKATVNIPQPPANQYGQPVNVNQYGQPMNQYGQPVNQYGQPVNGVQQPINEGGDRGLYAEMERKLNEMHGVQSTGTPMPTQQVPLTEGQIITQTNAVPNMLNEQITQTITNIFKEMGSSVLQEAMNDTIVETYKTERVKIALQENREYIKKIIVEIIGDMQKKQKSKKQQTN